MTEVITINNEIISYNKGQMFVMFQGRVYRKLNNKATDIENESGDNSETDDTDVVLGEQVSASILVTVMSLPVGSA